MSNIIEWIASFAECYTVVHLCNKFFDFKVNRLRFLKSFAIFTALFIDNVVLSQLDGFENVSVFIMLLLIFGYCFFFLKGKIYEKLLISIVPTITALPINIITLNLFQKISNCSMNELTEPDGSLRFMVLFFSKLGFFLACEAIIRLRKKGNYSLNGMQWLIQLSCFFISFLIANSLVNVMRKSGSTDDLLFLGVIIAILNVLLYILLCKMQRDSIIREEYNLSKINLAAQERLVTEAREQYLEINTLRHDIKHCLMTTAELISNGKITEATDYIEQIISEKVASTAPNVDTGSAVIDAAINSRLIVCAKNNIKVKIQIDTMLKGINEVDMSILISNIFDNAINGCKGTTEPYIELLITRQKSFIRIVIKNSIPASVLTGNPELKTSNKDSSIHGFGVKSIRKIADKYDGNVGFKENNDMFITEIWLHDVK